MTPERIGKYKVLGLLGRGGMGDVYRALDEPLDREVAIKMISAAAQVDPDTKQRFLVEAKAAARLQHPNIITIYELGENLGVPFIAMELLDGRDLEWFLKHGERLLLTETLEVLIQVCRALAYAHEHGVVHRDMKPSNIRLLEDGTAKILDFGIAKLGGNEMQTGLTRTGVMVGSVHYMSPEQIRGGHTIDGRSDIFSVGTILYEALAGNRPFRGDSIVEVFFKTVHEPPLPVDLTGFGGVGPRLQVILDRCLAKLPEERYPSASALADELAGALEALRPSAPPPADDVGEEVAAARKALREDRVSAAVHGLRRVLARYPEHGVARWLLRAARLRKRDDAAAAPSASLPPSPTMEIVAPRPAALTSRGPAPAAGPPSRWSPAPRIDDEPSERTVVEVPAASAALPSPSTGRPVEREPEAQAGTVVGRFTLHEELARGHSGTLYRAYDPVRGRLIGLKLVPGGDAETKKRLLRGARIWLELRHPALIRVLEVQPDYHGYAGVIVTDLVEGVDLNELTKRMRLTLEQVMDIGLQLCDGLAHIHGIGVVHREVLPRNVLVTIPGYRVTLLDSGIARHANPEIDAFTRTGVVVGDLAFAAPEQFQGKVDQRADVYALATILCQLLTGKRPSLPGPGKRPDPLAGASEVPQRLKQALYRALEADTGRRFSSVQEFADHLRTFGPGGRRSTSAAATVVTLHGIRTQARWQRSFAEVAAAAGLQARLDRWNFGYFSVFRFLLPRSRLARVRWFRRTYESEFPHLLSDSPSAEAPSIIAHSFGTYILGNALLRYPYLRFSKVVLCGSILPTDFPWDQIIERGQVQAVRNEFGTEDLWTRAVAWFVRGTGPSGLVGFGRGHARLEQERFFFSHSEYFERTHMHSRWVPFLTMHTEPRPLEQRAVDGLRLGGWPWGLYALYAVLMGIVAIVAIRF